jgi:hypothetical protein
MSAIIQIRTLTGGSRMSALCQFQTSGLPIDKSPIRPRLNARFAEQNEKALLPSLLGLPLFRLGFKRLDVSARLAVVGA